MIKFLWLSKHLSEDTQELKRIFNSDIEVMPATQQIKTGKEVIDLMQLFECKEVIAVLPPNFLIDILKEGYEQPVMMREINADGSTSFILAFRESENTNIKTAKADKKEVNYENFMVE